MALVRLGLKRIEQSFLSSQHNSRGIVDSGKQYWISVIRGLASESEKAGNGEVAVTEARERTSTAPRRRRRGWWRGDRELLPFGFDDFFRPNAFGNALYEMADSLNRMVDDLSPLSTRYFGQLKEDDNSYRLRYEVPGLTKDDLNITLEDRNLVIRGEHKEEKRDETAGGDGFWSSSSYGYYNSRLQLPMDANVGDIKAELKHGILYLTIPKVESKGKEVKKIEIQ